MDGSRFDALARGLASPRSRRDTVKALVAAAAGLGLGRAAGGAAAPDGNSACARFCKAAFPPGRARGQCVSDAAHGTGPCVACGGNPVRFCNGACVELGTNDNCAFCGNACTSPAVCHQGACCTPLLPAAVCTDRCSCAPQPVGCGLPDADCGRFLCDAVAPGADPPFVCRGPGDCCEPPGQGNNICIGDIGCASV